ncbi:NAD(P)/FAD-dependent oxidoreductase [Galbitalea soli]|uniref:FAD-dependent oxidoreductase n=1 Tax=Galbitalea soli TaxID=1268042 RepID=A0A7C9TTQ3_9MICO|nr:FAD-dependent oxidoreductase [Galbitalea soli]NEM92384.1 FAD-dependent oxidoreductase [Galbitalea soli]NYJ31659.1 NADPH-dependent 2,4-dienoyl-CoA reductase/sulfur reductase-like enzyme [Galbitalea soli]
MTDEKTFVIVGAALAGASAAGELREQGFDGRIVLIGAENRYPYIRPPLSKGFLAGKEPVDAIYVHPEEWYDEHDIDFMPAARVESIDPAAHTVSIENGDTIAYDRLLLTTGARPRTLDSLPGIDLRGVHQLRTVLDAERLKPLLAGGTRRLAVIGSGWIGMEVAATARELGNEVLILEHQHVPLSAALGDELGRFFAALHEEHGVVLRTGVDVVEISGIGGEVAGIRVGGRHAERADLVLVAVGALPNIRLAEEAGLAVDNGILVDAALTTSDPDIFAAGDVANAWHPFVEARVRSEHWANAIAQGSAAARSMLGHAVSFDDIPYFYTDQFEVGMEFVGFSSLLAGAKTVYRGDPSSREFIVFWVADERVVAGMNVNVWDVSDDIKGVIRRRNRIDPVKLADVAVPLTEL